MKNFNKNTDICEIKDNEKSQMTKNLNLTKNMNWMKNKACFENWIFKHFHHSEEKLLNLKIQGVKKCKFKHFWIETFANWHQSYLTSAIENKKVKNYLKSS